MNSDDAPQGEKDQGPAPFIRMEASETFDGQERWFTRAAYDLQCRAVRDSAFADRPGFVPDEYLNSLDMETTFSAIDLCAIGTWERVDGGYRILDWESVEVCLDYVRQVRGQNDSQAVAWDREGEARARGQAGKVTSAAQPAAAEYELDLDQVAGLISCRVSAWAQAGFLIGSLTWRDVGVPWPYPLKTDRREVADADSVGIKLRKRDQEGRLVIFRRGWADLEYWTGRYPDNPFVEAVGADSPMAFPDVEQLLERFTALFRLAKHRDKVADPERGVSVQNVARQGLCRGHRPG